MSNKIVNNRVQKSASDAFSFPETWSSVEISVQVAWPLLALSTNKHSWPNCDKATSKDCSVFTWQTVIEFSSSWFWICELLSATWYWHCDYETTFSFFVSEISFRSESGMSASWLYSDFHSCKFGVDLTSPGDNTPLSNWFSSPGKSYEVSSGPNDEQPPLIKKKIKRKLVKETKFWIQSRTPLIFLSDRENPSRRWRNWK